MIALNPEPRRWRRRKQRPQAAMIGGKPEELTAGWQARPQFAARRQHETQLRRRVPLDAAFDDIAGVGE
jgi:hypothetical protein